MNYLKHIKNHEWKELLLPFFESKDYQILERAIERRISDGEIVYPAEEDTFRALNACPYSKTKVVILGQDPYHNGSADGLAFSSRSKKVPKSLKNILDEAGCQYDPDKAVTLDSWASQGVLLLNTCLTVAKGKAGSHFDLGWEKLTDLIISLLSDKGDVVFMLWGKKAQEKELLIDSEKNEILKTSHPSPFSVNKGFKGCGHFEQVKEIDWTAL